MDLRNLYFVIRDAVRFVHRKAGTEHAALPEPSGRGGTDSKGQATLGGPNWFMRTT